MGDTFDLYEVTCPESVVCLGFYKSSYPPAMFEPGGKRWDTHETGYVCEYNDWRGHGIWRSDLCLRTPKYMEPDEDGKLR